MQDIVKGGQNVYGYDIGVLMLDSTFPRIKGDIGNAQTWEFPVLYEKVKGGTPQKVVLELTVQDIQPFIDAAKKLERAGVKAITTSCGFLALFQQELSESVNIPVFTSALLFVPMLSKMIGKNKKVGIMTANSKTLSERHLRGVGIEDLSCVVKGLEDGEVFTNFTVENWDCVSVDACRKELVEVAAELTKDADIGAIVLECTNMSPFAKDIQEIAGVPVFDIVMLVNMFYRALNQKSFR